MACRFDGVIAPAACIGAGVLGVLVLAGCVHASPYVGPHGERQVVVTCSSGFHDQADCYAAARETCGGDFDVLGENMEESEFFFPSFTCLGPSMIRSKRGLNVRCTGFGAATRTPQPPAALPGSCKADSDCAAGQVCAFGTGVEGLCTTR